LSEPLQLVVVQLQLLGLQLQLVREVQKAMKIGGLQDHLSAQRVESAELRVEAELQGALFSVERGWRRA
jgi:hypothetical protein